MRLTRSCVLACCLATGVAGAARIPFRHYTSAHGLAQDAIVCLAADADGFLWIGTQGGLDRFDGDRFTSFGEADGLAGRQVHDVALGPGGTDWVATDAGLFAFRPGTAAPPGGLFRPVALDGLEPGDEAFRLLAARDGTLWVGTLRALYRVRTVDGVETASRVDLELGSRVQALAEGPDGAIWVGTHAEGIVRVSPSGAIDRLPATVPGADFVRAFRFDPDGSVWTAFFGGVAIFEPPVFVEAPRVRVLGYDDGVPIDTSGFVENGEHSVLLGSTLGVTEIVRDGPGRPLHAGRTLDRRSGLPADHVRCLTRDAAGNLWIGTASRGLARRIEGGFTTLEDTSGPGAIVVDLTDDRDGRPLAVSFVGGKAIAVVRPELDAAPPVRVSLPATVRYTGWGAAPKLVQTDDGTWWVGTGSGVFRYAPTSAARGTLERLASPPDGRLSRADGLPGDDVFSLHRTPAGDLWISTESLTPGTSSLAVRDAHEGTIRALQADAVGTRAPAMSYADAPDGSLWVAFLDGTLVRIRDTGVQRIETPPGADTHPALLIDHDGRVWLPGAGGVWSADARADIPRFERHAMRADVTRTEFWCATEDRLGRLWFGSSQGAYRIDPDSGEERRFTSDDGLVGNLVPVCHRDGAGVLWFSDYAGVSRFEPGTERPPTLAPARLRELRFAGEAVSLPSTGASEAGPFTVGPARRRVAVEYFAVHLGPGPPPRFQYRLEGADADWSAPTRRRAVQYAALAPGRYRFAVRTVDEEGTASPTVAGFAFRVLAPVWARWWFLTLAALGLAVAVHAAYRVRIARVLALERVRTRIATDLHDDVGSSLSQISILSQLAGREIEASGGRPPASLSRITELSGEVVDALGDVVWAINPQRDRLSDLARRMHRFAGELFAEGGVTLRFDLPDAGADEPLDADVRRQVYLVFKEAMHNVLRHSGATSVEVRLRREAGGLLLRIRDDGRGIADDRGVDDGRSGADGRRGAGHGLASMRRRAASIGAELTIGAGPGGGTEILLRSGTGPRRGKPSTWIVGRRRGSA